MVDHIPLQELIEFTRDGEWGNGEPADDLVKMAVIRGTDFASVRGGDVSSVPIRYIPKKAADRKALRPGDLVIETAGGTKDQPTGRTLYLPERVFDALGVPVTCASFSRFLRVRPAVVDPRYLFWYLQSIYAAGQMLPYHIQHTGVARFQYTDFASQWRIPVPAMDHQLEVAEVLCSFDEKIELNRRMNETLEAMAQAIFRDWFVDFGPTRRKTEGATDPVEIIGGLVTDPGQARQLADLFPASFGGTGMPEDWRPGRLEDVLELAYGKSLTRTDRRDGPYPVYGSGGIGGWHDAALVRGPSVIVGRKGTVGSLYWEDRDFYPIDTVFYVKSLLPMTFCYYLLQTLGLEGMNTDAAVPGLNRSNAYRLDITIAEPAIIRAFHAHAGLWRQKIATNVTENETLAATRDLLLPKLMSGAIRLRKAERQLEAAQ
ncbi:restriction endonuclease subunit S [Mesorhizobium sp.]|uniref:restriction endonuclease subunit S n=1 Tax=Mesorhizobium sp. TaxID=1871066 RepID=UPI000FE3C3CD|nr:restriction endonuclease subunit S [Mesorhizobium sp.]RWJ96994.1 MAG: restriction endonuclease subunit S [Mesorhizobium sp.]